MFDIVSQLEPLQVCRPVLVSSQVGYRKPHPRFFEAIRSALGSEAGRILYVGDDPRNDMTPARAVGLEAVLLDRDASAADGAVASLMEILPLVFSGQVG